MWLLFKGLALRFIVGRTLGGLMGLLLVLLVPLAGVLKFIGLPILIVLGVLAAPVLLLLAAVGLPMLLVVGIGGFLIAVVGMLLALGLLALKVVLPVVLIVWFVRWVWRALRTPPAGSGSPDVATDPGPVTGAPD